MVSARSSLAAVDAPNDRILYLTASGRSNRSHSRSLGDHFIRGWLSRRPDTLVMRRDVGCQPPPAVDEAWIAAAFAETGRRTAAMWNVLRLSELLVDELAACTRLVIATPIYNFGMPASLKAWVDQVVRVGRTFQIERQDSQVSYRPLLADRPCLVMVAAGDGGNAEGGRNRHLNYLEPHLRTVLGFIGIASPEFVYAENDEVGGVPLAESLAAARTRLDDLLLRDLAAAPSPRLCSAALSDL